ncbi:hypothetical protein T09_15328 [Trichinella sp. T9]|nr:hypothetical protein T09_15328 [Trichinella sp. T9]
MHHSNVIFRSSSDLRHLLIAGSLDSFVNNGRLTMLYRVMWYEQSSYFNASHLYPTKRDYADKFWTKCEATHLHASAKVAVAGERAQSSFDVVFSEVVALRRSCVYVRACGWVPPKTASTGMLLLNPFVSSMGGEAQ